MQLVNMSAHLEQWEIEIKAMIPDPAAAPVVGLDWEAWQPYWNGNNREWSEPGQDISQNESIKLVKARHPSWSEAQVLVEAKRQFNAGAQELWTKTFELAQKLRPNALWSNYDVGHCAASQVSSTLNTGDGACDDAEYYPWLAR
jgi:hypothetical protein